VHPAIRKLFQQLEQLRVAAGLSSSQVETALLLGPGWVEQIESGEYEPPLGLLAALLKLYGTDLPTFFAQLDLGNEALVPERHLSASQAGDAIQLHFPMGSHAATVTIPNATLADLNTVVGKLRDELAIGRSSEAIARAFLTAVQKWPHSNPSDLWYFLIAHAYQDDYNHSASEAGREWSQSWKRASGWALEAVVVRHYGQQLEKHGIQLEMPPPERRIALLRQMGIQNPKEMEAKADVIAIGRPADGGEEQPFGVVHIKASFAERRTDDVPLSQELIAKGFASPFVTMDCKASPGPEPVNRGELGPTQGGTKQVSAKRFDIERDNKFDACFSYNKNTKPTPAGQAAPARIYVLDFANPDDRFSRHLVARWRQRQGLA
jgi:transcriptional regulator with XRE-family HTH domain